MTLSEKFHSPVNLSLCKFKIPRNREVFFLNFNSLSRITHPRRNTVDGQMNAVLHAVIRLPRTPAAHQLNLQVVERVDIGKAVANGTCQCRVVGQAVFVTGDVGQRLHRALPFRLNRAKNAFAQPGVGHQFAIARCQIQVTLGQHHVHI